MTKTNNERLKSYKENVEAQSEPDVGLSAGERVPVQTPDEVEAQRSDEEKEQLAKVAKEQRAAESKQNVLAPQQSESQKKGFSLGDIAKEADRIAKEFKAREEAVVKKVGEQSKEDAHDMAVAANDIAEKAKAIAQEDAGLAKDTLSHLDRAGTNVDKGIKDTKAAAKDIVSTVKKDLEDEAEKIAGQVKEDVETATSPTSSPEAWHGRFDPPLRFG